MLRAYVPRPTGVLGGHEAVAVADVQRLDHARNRAGCRVSPACYAAAVGVRSKQITARGLTFDALTTGPQSGELVLLLHGFPQMASCWRNALTSLGAAGFHAVAPTQRGYSAGALPEELDAYRLDELCADALAIATALGSTSFHVIGHDWGGVVAWALAADNPDTIASLTAVSTPHGAALRAALTGTRQRLQMSYVAVLRLSHVPELLFEAGGGLIIESALELTGLSREHARRDITALRKVGATGALNWYRAVGRGTLRQRPPVVVPTLHIWGDRDVAFTREAIELSAEHVEGQYHLVELTGGTHWIPDEHWDDVDDLVLEHLQSNPIGLSAPA
jgi:pimeloyl-ACP methyl ester carboxylesterase